MTANERFIELAPYSSSAPTLDGMTIDMSSYATVNAVTAAEREQMIFPGHSLSMPMLTAVQSGKNYRYAPQPDITALESALLCGLFLSLMYAQSQNQPINWPGFVDMHGLWRHFKGEA
jgi:hypothetical protein